MLSRRKFMQGILGGVASVSIAMKLSQGMPQLTQPSFDLVPEEVKFKATERFSYGWIDQRALYGTPIIDVRVNEA